MIKNKLKISVSLAIVALVAFVGVKTAFAVSDLTFTDDTIIAIGANNYTISGGSEATSIAINTGSTAMTVVIPAAKTFTLVSQGRFTLNNDQVGAVLQCTQLYSTLTATGAMTIVITPDATTPCSPYLGGGGGGGGGTTTTTTTVTPPVTTVVIAGCEGRNTGFSTVDGQSCATNTVTVNPPVITVTGTVIAGCNGSTGFSTTTGVSCAGNTAVAVAMPSHDYDDMGTAVMKVGSKGIYVTHLQLWLNAHMNAGLKADGSFGKGTKAAVMKWQASVGLGADGIIGAKSRAQMAMNPMMM